MQDFWKGGSIIILHMKCAPNCRSHAHFWLKPHPFLLVVCSEKQFALPVNRSVFDRKSCKDLLRWASAIVLQPERGVPFSLSSVLSSDWFSPKGSSWNPRNHPKSATVTGKLVIIFMADVLHQFTQNASLINQKSLMERMVLFMNCMEYL